MASGRNCSGVSGTHMTGDMDEEGLIAFNAMAQEAMKIERLVIQQKELSRKLEEMLEKSQKSEEKNRERQKILQNDIYSYLTKNKLLKENLQGKRNTRNMMEQMTSDLDRQLLLEHNDITNKKDGFLRVQHKYAEMWDQYEYVYLSSEEAKDMSQMRMARQKAVMLLQKLQQDKENAKNNIKKSIEDRDTEMNNLLIKFAGLQHELQVVQEEKRKTETEMKTLSEETAQNKENILKVKEQQAKKNSVELMDVEKSSVSEADKIKNKDLSFGSRYKNILSFGHITLPELELPKITTEDQNLTVDENDTMFDYGLSYNQYEECEALVENTMLPTLDLSRPATPVISQPEVHDQRRETTVSMQEETELTEMEVETQISNQPQSDEITHELNVNSDTFYNPNQEQQVLEVAIEQEPFDNQAQQAQSTEHNEEAVAEQTTPDEQMQQEEEVPDTESQVWDADSCQGELAIMHGQTPYFNSGMSQSSEGSNFDLLDDAKRQAYLRKLMSSPEFPVDGRFASCQLGSSGQNIHQMYQPPNSGTVPQISDHENMEEDRESNNQVAENDPAPQASEERQQQTQQPNNAVSFAPMTSFFGSSFGQTPQQPQTSSDQPGFAFEAFSFGSPMAQNVAPAASFFGGGSPFGESSTPQKGSEAFNLNFDNKTNSTSIFKLF